MPQFSHILPYSQTVLDLSSVELKNIMVKSQFLMIEFPFLMVKSSQNFDGFMMVSCQIPHFQDFHKIFHGQITRFLHVFSMFSPCFERLKSSLCRTRATPPARSCWRHPSGTRPQGPGESWRVMASHQRLEKNGKKNGGLPWFNDLQIGVYIEVYIFFLMVKYG